MVVGAVDPFRSTVLRFYYAGSSLFVYRPGMTSDPAAPAATFAPSWFSAHTA
jgi:hypothetical protein